MPYPKRDLRYILKLDPFKKLLTHDALHKLHRATSGLRRISKYDQLAAFARTIKESDAKAVRHPGTLNGLSLVLKEKKIEATSRRKSASYQQESSFKVGTSVMPDFSGKMTEADVIVHQFPIPAKSSSVSYTTTALIFPRIDLPAWTLH